MTNMYDSLSADVAAGIPAAALALKNISIMTVYLATNGHMNGISGCLSLMIWMRGIYRHFS